MSEAPNRIYDAKQMAKISKLFGGIEALYKEFEPPINNNNEPLYIFSTEIVIRHKDGFTVGRIGMDDFLFFELTDENYGEPKGVKK